MGSLRGGVILAVLPGVARAEVCAALRPDWDGTEATQVTEAIGLLLSPIGLFLTAALVVAVIARHSLGVALAALLWSFFITLGVLPGASGQGAAAIAEGCAAPPTLFIALVTAICGASVYYTFRRETRL